jgi:hypothetical protein
MAFWSKNDIDREIRVIKTARDKDEINLAAKNGFKPLIKKINPSPDIRAKYCVFQNKKTGEIEVSGDYRIGFHSNHNDDFELVIDWTFFYPYNFKSPFAAYLIPSDIKIGETVFIEDLIEDIVGSNWSQGDNYRLDSCEAVWNGVDLVVAYNPRRDHSNFIG